jgi:hypothetical protein
MNSAQTRKVIAAGMIGNVLEWYDFAIYGYFASAIGRQFFPHEDPVAQLLSAFSVFALGYLMRALPRPRPRNELHRGALALRDCNRRGADQSGGGALASALGEQRHTHQAEDLCAQFPRLYWRITGKALAAGTARAG